MLRNVVLEAAAAINILDSLEAVQEDIKNKVKICLNSQYYVLTVMPDMSWELCEKECPSEMADEYYSLKESIPHDARCGLDLGLQEKFAEQIARLRYIEAYDWGIEPYRALAEEVDSYMADYYDQWEDLY